MSMQFSGFSQAQLPQAKITAEHTQHNISSCKLFFPLTEQYWGRPDNRIPQVIVTDTYIQDVYSLAWNTGAGDQGVILASYTWEDDSLKLLPFDQQKLVDLVLTKLRQITVETVQQDITEYIVKDAPVMIQWINEPTYDGCAKLYRQRDEGANFIDLSYNQDFGSQSHLYFAGENYSVEGGWTEPALRSALDGVMQLLHHVGADFRVANFNFDQDYPKWQI
jgi:tryptophan 2-monooxygenase